ncbi:MAG: hypothetical protein WCO67_26860, partial [Betaproteobacteria bacterium]
MEPFASVDDQLTARITALLPEDWQHDVHVVRFHDGFAVGFADAEGGRHRLQARGIEDGVPALVQGQRFGFSYAKLGDASEQPATVARYRVVMESLRDQESLLAEDLGPAPVIETRPVEPTTQDAEPTPPIVYEVSAEWTHSDFLAQPSASEALTARITALLPEDWQHDVH